MITSLTKKIIFDYFYGNHSSIQYKMIEDWLKIEGNQELFYQYLDEWESQNPQYIFDVEKGTLNISERIKEVKAYEKIDSIENNEELKTFSFNYKWLVAAAVLLVFSWVGFQEFTKKEKFYNKDLVSNAKKINGEVYEKENLTLMPLFVSLPDKSSVILLPNSKISYSPYQYNKSKREVLLSGEAFFEVQKNSDIPFFVYTNKLITKVLGTSFTVKSEDSVTEVIVKTGRVSIIMQNDIHKKEKIDGKSLEGFVLSANEQVLINKNDEIIEKAVLVKQTDLLHPIQKLSFDFDETPAIEIIEIIKKAYNIEIIYNKEKLMNCKLTAHLTDEPLIEKIKLICIALEASYIETENNFVIKSNGCI